MTVDELETLHRAIERYGEKTQALVAAGECAELTDAILKYYNQGREEALDKVLEEMADVEIMLEQLKIIHIEHSDTIAQIKSAKIKRLKERLNK